MKLHDWFICCQVGDCNDLYFALLLLLPKIRLTKLLGFRVLGLVDCTEGWSKHGDSLSSSRPPSLVFLETLMSLII